MGCLTTSSRMLIERMLHNSASVMLRQKEEENIPDYPLFTHEEIDRISKRFIGIPFGQAKHVNGPHDACLDRLDLIVLVVNRTSRTCEVVDLVDL